MARRSPLLYFACREILRHTWGRLHSVRVQGLEHLPRRGPAILCPKHQRWEDIVAVALALPPPLYYIAKVELFTLPFVREFLRALGGVPVDRQNPRATLSSFRQIPPLLYQGAYVVLFPEGTYVPGRVGPGKHRLIQMFLRLQHQNGLGPLPFVPVGLQYHHHSRRFSVTVQLGPPQRARRAQEAPALTHRLMQEIAGLSYLPLSSGAAKALTEPPSPCRGNDPP
jgi:1-acyl-sn-glycerol-3-phosphate acyltransferase